MCDATVRGSHDLSARRARRTKSSGLHLKQTKSKADYSRPKHSYIRAPPATRKLYWGRNNPSLELFFLSFLAKTKLGVLGKLLKVPQLDDLCIDICISLMIKSLSHYPDNREMGYSNVLIYEGPRMKHAQNEARDVYIYI